MHLDVTNSKECIETIKKVIDEQGKIDGLVADAGITRDALIGKMTDEMFDRLLI